MFLKKINTFLRESEAATAVEYAIMLALIIATCLVAIGTLGGSNGALWGNTMTQVDQTFSQSFSN